MKWALYVKTVIRQYGMLKKKEVRHMHAWESIQKTVDHIEEHLAEDICITDLAAIAALSPFYFQRLFTRLVRKTVNEYIKLRRLARAAETLSEKGRRILDIALDTGFSSHEVFTRAFKHAYNMTPEEYRENPVRLNHFCKPQLLLQYTLVDENVPLIADGIVIEITRRILSVPEVFLGLSVEAPMAGMPGSEVTGVDSLSTLWDTFHLQKPGIPGLIEGGDELGVAYGSDKPGYYQYFGGAQATADTAKDGYATWTLEAGTYLVCTFEAEDFEHLVTDALYKAQQYLFDMWLPRHKLSSKPFAIERYAQHSPETTVMEVWLMPESMDSAEP